MSRTERIAHWSAQHWKTAFFGWIAIAIFLGLASGVAGTKTIDSTNQNSGQATTASKMLIDSKLMPDASEVVMISSATQSPDSPASAALAEKIANAVSKQPHIENVQWNQPGLIAADNKARIVTFDVRNDDSTASENVIAAATAVKDIGKQNTDFTIQQVGDATTNNAINKVVGQDLSKSESMTLPVTLVILLVTFGALVAAGLPLLIGAISVFAALSIGTLASHLVPQSEFAPNLVSMMGIALGVDYTLFLLRREREERAAGQSPANAIRRAARTSGSAIVISAITVIVALSGLLVSGSSMFVSMGLATMFVVGTALFGALIVVPALLSKLGNRVERGRLPFAGKAANKPIRESRVWKAVVTGAVRKPALTTLVFGAVLLAAAVPALGMKTADSNINSFPQNLPFVQQYNNYNSHFPGEAEPARVVLQSQDGSKLATMADRIQRDVVNSGVAAGDIATTISTDGKTEMLAVPIANSLNRDAADHEVSKLRKIVSSDTKGVTGIKAAVGGSAAESHDFAKTLTDHMPIVFAVVLGSAFLLLMCAFRSVVVPLVAVALNLLSVGAAYGFLVWGFQNRHLNGIIDVANTGVVVSWMPLFLFTLLFGLSMDYHVFMLSRIRERVLEGFSTRDAVVGGVSKTASTITSAALIMVSVFSAFAMSRIPEMQQMGAGLAFAILIDATIIRGLLLPAVMTLLGKHNWYLPTWLNWLPRINAEGKGDEIVAIEQHDTRERLSVGA